MRSFIPGSEAMAIESVVGPFQGALKGEIDPATWQPVEMHDGPSLWGHERIWLPARDRELAREMRMRAAAEGRRAPVQVMAGNFRLMSGTCPWWDEVSGQSR